MGDTGALHHIVFCCRILVSWTESIGLELRRSSWMSWRNPDPPTARPSGHLPPLARQRSLDGSANGTRHDPFRDMCDDVKRGGGGLKTASLSSTQFCVGRAIITSNGSYRYSSNVCVFLTHVSLTSKPCSSGSSERQTSLVTASSAYVASQTA